MNKLLVLILLPTSLLSALDLPTSIRLALENNVALQSERLSLSKEEISLNKAKRSEFYPEIEAKITQGETKEITWEKDEEGVERRVTTKTKDKPALELDSTLSRPHPLGGKLRLNLKTTTGFQGSQDNKWEVGLESEEPLSRYQRKKAKEPLANEKLSLNIARIDLEDKINETIYSCVEQYYDLQNLKISLEIKEKELKDLQDSLEISKLKAEKGIIPEMDILQIELQISSVFNEIESLKKEEKDKLNRFGLFLGIEQTAVVESQKDNINNEIEKVRDYASADLEDLEKFSQIKRKRIEIEQAKRALEEAKSKNLPVFIPSYSISGDKKERQEKLSLSLSLTLYDKGIQKEEIKEAKINLSQARLELKNLLSSIKIDIAETMGDIDNRAMRLKTSEDDISLSEKLYEIARIKYERGLISAKDLLEYQRDLFTKQSNVFSENSQLFLDYIKLIKMKGGLYDAYKENILGM
ncbi:MAG: TolC family protein [bacterium]